jgi:hypothetical protein
VSYYQATPVRLIEPTGEQHEFPSAKAAAKFLGPAWTATRVKQQAHKKRRIFQGPRAGWWVIVDSPFLPTKEGR